MKKIKVGVIGTGFMGSTHIETIKRIGGADIVGIASEDQESMKDLVERYDIEVVYDDWRELVSNPDIDIIHNCTPNHLHFEINKETIKASKHIISEKPLTVSSDESKELLDLLTKYKVVNVVNFNYRFYPLIQHVKAEISSNDFGDIFYVHGHYLQDWLFHKNDYNWRLESKLSGSSRAVADIGSHWCDMVQFLTGQKIIEVFANLITIHNTRIKPTVSTQTFAQDSPNHKGNTINIDTEDTGTVMIKFENGSQGVFTVSQVSAGRKNNFLVIIDGSKKSFEWNQENPNEIWIGHRDKANEKLIKDPSLLNSAAKGYAHYPGGHPEGYPDGTKNLFMRVYDFIRSGKKIGIDSCDFPTFLDGYTENKIVDAIIKSNKEKQWIKV